ncbi:DUF421 domain-containing protein [Ammoniphilus sp. YIM 78166]|uniref:DUF421 domain-containing protein n=1 Tax=Ammoniphilus sp. YIM 78166 TaxID=1644106 RepID=UPI00106F8AED|nr:DUF421 domain-containing protein [Ammoniphilus sp. YIM 78166]
MNFVWESIIVVIGAMILLRIAGRKSISQMTISTTIVMLSVGNIIVQPIIEKSIWKTLAVIMIFVTVLIILEFLMVRTNWLEKLLIGKAVTLVEDGKIVPHNLRKMRFTIDQLEMRLRQQGITNISDIKTATLETNGQLGYELYPDARPLTVGEFKKMMGLAIQQQPSHPAGFDIFDEVRQEEHAKPLPKQFQ